MKGLPAADLQAELREAGLRVTSQRLQVLEILHESDGHLYADEIHAIAQTQYERISLATIYRTIGVLKEEGLVEPHYFAGEHEKERFEFAPDEDHYHFKCQACGRVYEFETDIMQLLRASLRAEKGWLLSSNCMCFEGTCEECTSEQL